MPAQSVLFNEIRDEVGQILSGVCQKAFRDRPYDQTKVAVLIS